MAWIVFAIATSPSSGKSTSTTYRSAGAITTLGTHISRSNRPTSDATSFARADPKVTLKVRVLATLVMKKRITSPGAAVSVCPVTPLTSITFPKRPMSAWVGASFPHGMNPCPSIRMSSRTSISSRWAGP